MIKYNEIIIIVISAIILSMLLIPGFFLFLPISQNNHLHLKAMEYSYPEITADIDMANQDGIIRIYEYNGIMNKVNKLRERQVESIVRSYNDSLQKKWPYYNTK